MKTGPGHLLCILFTLCAAGCAAARTDVEEDERARIAAVEQSYPERTHEQRSGQLGPAPALGDYVRFALLNNPDVRASFYAWKAAVDAITVARYLPDPELTLEAEINRIDDLLMAGIMFMVPAPGKIALRAEAYSIQARMQRFAFQQEVLQTAFDVKRSLYSLHALGVQIEQTARIADALEQLRELSVMRQRVGLATQLEVLAVEREQAAYATKLNGLRDNEDLLQAELAAALGLGYERDLSVPDSLPFTQAMASEDELWRLVRERNPSLARRRDLVELSEVYLRAAYREYLPDFAVGVERSFFADMGMTKPMLGLSIPWIGKVKAQVAAAENSRQGARAALRAEELDRIVGLADALYRWRQADREEKLLNGVLIPSIRSSIEIAAVEYRSGEAGLDDLLRLDIERSRLDSALAEARALREIALHEVMLVLAGDLPDEEKPFAGGFEDD